MTKRTNRGYTQEVLDTTRAIAWGPRSQWLLTFGVGLLVACGQQEKGGTESTTSDASSSASTGSSGASSSAAATTSVTSNGGASSGVTSGVGNSSSFGDASTQSSASSSINTTVGSTGGASSSIETSESDTSSTTSNDGETSAVSDEDAIGPDAGEVSTDTGGGTEDDGSMTFFVTSTGVAEGGNLGGLDGADAFCTQLAAAVSESLGTKSWRAYLSTSTVNARDRIGTGPWRNVEGVIVANNVDELHAQEPGEALDETWPPTDLSIALTENGEQVPNMIHDVLTGSLPDGTVDAGRHCNDWTSSESTDEASVGHSNRDGGGRPPYFNATHQVGCAPSATNYQEGTVTSGGGQGSIYCFALIGG